MNGRNKAGESAANREAHAPGLSLRVALAQLMATQGDAAAVEYFLGALALPIALLDETGAIRWTSAAFDALLGEALPPGTAWNRVVPMSIEYERTMLRARHGQPASTECQLPKGVALRLRYSPIRAANGDVVAVGVSAISVAEQRGLELELRRSNFLLQQIGALATEHVLILDREQVVLYLNRAIGRVMPEFAIGRALRDVLPAATYEALTPAFERVAKTRSIDRFSLQLQRAGGELRHYDVQLAPLWREGELHAYTLSSVDTTEQMRAERAIAMQARMIESMLEGVAMVNDEHFIEISNPAFDAMFGYRRGELIGRGFEALSVRPLMELKRWSPDTTEQKTASLHLEFEAKRRDGSVFAVAGILSRFEIAGRHQNLVVLQDVSERKQLERAILQAVNREQYRIGNDLHDGLGQELTGIALMLRSVAGRLQIEYPALLPEIDGITKLVNNAVESTRALARGLSPVNLERGGLKDALDALAMHARELYGVQVAFAHRTQGAKPLSPELANHLYRIAQEAIRNAVRHGKARIIRLHLSIARGKVRLVIADDGNGLPAQALEAPGIGLKIMRYRARMVGGEVRFEAAEPQGTRVICECPLELALQPAATPPAKPARRKRASRAGGSSGA